MSWYEVDMTEYIHGTELIQFGMRLVWFRKVTLSDYCVHCILYSRIHLVDFMIFLYIAQTRQSARFFLQSAELGLLRPLNSRRVCSPALASEGILLQSWCDCIKWPYGIKKISIEWLLTSQSDIKSNKEASKGFVLILGLWPFTMKHEKLPSLQFPITDQMSLLWPLRMIGQYNLHIS